MKAISFAWTAASLLAGRKTVTRREWDAAYAVTFHARQEIAAYDRQPRHGGRRIATVRLTATPVYESMSAMPDSDYEAEGHAFLASHPEFAPKTINGEKVGPDTFSFMAFERWRERDGAMWVVRFCVVDIASALPPKLAQAAALRTVGV